MNCFFCELNELILSWVKLFSIVKMYQFHSQISVLSPAIFYGQTVGQWLMTIRFFCFILLFDSNQSINQTAHSMSNEMALFFLDLSFDVFNSFRRQSTWHYHLRRAIGIQCCVEQFIDILPFIIQKRISEFQCLDRVV